MSSFNEILFATLESELKNITIGNNYYIDVKDFMQGVYLPFETSNREFQYPLAYAYRTDRVSAEIFANGNPAKREMNLFIGIVTNTDLTNSETDAENLCKSLDKYLLDRNENTLKAITGDDGYFSDYMILSDNIYYLSEVKKTVALYKIKITINLN